MLQRAHQAAYPPSSLKDMPAKWRSSAFVESEGRYILRPEFRQMVDFCRQDIREGVPAETFDLVMCRHLVFTYFADDVQKAVMRQLVERLAGGGFLVIGKKEALPESNERLRPHDAGLGIYQAR